MLAYDFFSIIFRLAASCSSISTGMGLLTVSASIYQIYEYMMIHDLTSLLILL
jgi:hypothetical protein